MFICRIAALTLAIIVILCPLPAGLNWRNTTPTTCGHPATQAKTLRIRTEPFLCQNEMSATNETPAARRPTVLIVGAGIAGLAAAKRLSQAKVSVVILESRDRVGGRINTHELACAEDGTTVQAELGASFVHGIIDNPLIQLSKEVPLSLHLPSERTSTRIYKDNACGVALEREESERLEYLSHNVTFTRSRLLAQEGQTIPGDDESIQNALAGDAVWRGIDDPEERQKIAKLSPIWAGWTGAELQHVSLKWWGFDQDFTGEDAVVTSGYSSLAHWAWKQAEASGAQLILNSKVTAVHDNVDDSGRFTVKATSTAQGRATQKTYLADCVISTLPLGVLQNDPPEFIPPLPRRKLDAIERIGFGLLNKIILVYDEPWWREGMHDHGEDGWLFVLPSKISAEASPFTRNSSKVPNGTQKPRADREAVRAELERTPLCVQDWYPMTGKAMLMLFFGPPAADALEAHSDSETWEDDLIWSIHSRLFSAIALPSTEERRPVGGKITRWRQDPHAFGSYSYLPARDDANGVPGASPLDLIELGRPVASGRLGFCGEACQPDTYASVHGAWLSGIREGHRISLLIAD